MTEFGKLGRQVESLGQELDQIEASISCGNHNVETVGKLIKSLESLNKQLESHRFHSDKFVSKKNQKDEITGELRFGPVMCGRIDKLDSAVRDLEQRNVLIATHLNELYNSVIQENELLKENMARENDERLFIEAQRIAQLEALAQEQLCAEQREREAREAQDAMLHEKAEEARVKRAQYIASKRHLLANLLNSLNSFHSKFNGPSLEEYITNIAKGNVAVKSMLTIVLDIMERITAKPDDIKLRKLKIDHPIIWDKVFSREHGLQVILLLAFQIELEGVETGCTLSPPSEWQSFDAHNLTSSILIEAVSDAELGPDVNIMLYLAEPDPSNSSMWINWFDGMSASIQILRNCLRS